MAPMVLRYSEFLMEGKARAVQYCVGQNTNLGPPRWSCTSLVRVTCACASEWNTSLSCAFSVHIGQS